MELPEGFKLSKLHENYMYNPATGQIQHILHKRTIGKIDGRGYIMVTLNGKRNYTHRFIWEEEHGEIPKGYDIDHLNFNKSDNRLENLQCVTHKENIHRSIPNRNATFARTNFDRETTVKAICEDGGETIFRSMYQVQKTLGINAGIVKMCITGQNNCKGGFSKVNGLYYTFELIKIGKHTNKGRPNTESTKKDKKYKCLCGGSYNSKHNKTNHCRTKRHLKYLELNNEN